MACPRTKRPSAISQWGRDPPITFRATIACIVWLLPSRENLKDGASARDSWGTHQPYCRKKIECFLLMQILTLPVPYVHCLPSSHSNQVIGIAGDHAIAFVDQHVWKSLDLLLYWAWSISTQGVGASRALRITVAPPKPEAPPRTERPQNSWNVTKMREKAKRIWTWCQVTAPILYRNVPQKAFAPKTRDTGSLALTDKLMMRYFLACWITVGKIPRTTSYVYFAGQYWFRRNISGLSFAAFQACWHPSSSTTWCMFASSVKTPLDPSGQSHYPESIVIWLSKFYCCHLGRRREGHTWTTARVRSPRFWSKGLSCLQILQDCAAKGINISSFLPKSRASLACLTLTNLQASSCTMRKRQASYLPHKWHNLLQPYRCNFARMNFFIQACISFLKGFKFIGFLGAGIWLKGFSRL